MSARPKRVVWFAAAPAPPPPSTPPLDLAVKRFERLLAAPEPASTSGPDPRLAPEQLERFAAVLAADPGRWRHLVRHERERMGAYRIGPGGELEREALSYEQELRAA